MTEESIQAALACFEAQLRLWQQDQHTLKRLLKYVGRSFESFDVILDFGCRCGRVTRFLKPNHHVLSRLKQDGFVYLKGNGTKGLPDFYQSTYHTKSYIEKQGSKYFKIMHLQTRAINNHQDGVVCQKE